MANIDIYNLEPSDSLVDLEGQEDVAGGWDVIKSGNNQYGLALNIGVIANPQVSVFGSNYSYNVLTQRASVNNTIR